MSGGGRRKKRRGYLPAVEALETLRPLSSAAPSLPGVPLASDFGTGAPAAPLDGATALTAWEDAWATSQAAPADPAAIESGLAQLDRYLNRAWYRAGIAPQQHADCTQAVYLTLLQNLGRDRFDSLVGEIGQNGIREVLSQETADGPDFFRAIDTVKKRAQRERSFQPLETTDPVASGSDASSPTSLRGALQEAIGQSLSPREAALIQATLHGETPTEISSRWGVAPKTVSNEKTRAIQKLRGALAAGEVD